MTASARIRSSTRASGLFAVAAWCVGLALMGPLGSAWAQIDPLKSAAVGRGEHNPPGDKGAHNPPSDKCGHNPPDDKVGKAADTRMVVPAVRSADQAKKLDAAKAATVACQNN
jgi:hypothetical protein